MQTKPWHTLTRDETYEKFNTTPYGLTSVEAAKRLQETGPNELQAARRVSPWEILLEQFKNVLILILLGATAISLILGHGVESIVIGIIVLFAVLLGFVQEYRAEHAIEALRKMAAPTATVLRDGVEVKIPARDLIPGDVILLHTGDRIPADARLLEAVNLQVDEAALTGESVPVEKNIRSLEKHDLPLGDRRNMAYAGTAVTYGRGRALVVATAMQTEFGKIAQMLQDVETGRTPLQQNLDKVGTLLARVGLCGRCHYRCAGSAARATVHRDAHLWHCPGSGGRSRSASCCRHHLAGDWCAKDGQTQRPHPPPARCGDAWQHFRDLLRQNRHTHQR